MVFNINPAGGGGSADKISVTDETAAALGLEAGAVVDAALKAGGCIRLENKPTAETVAPGGVGQLAFYDSTLYFCSGVIDGSYIWTEIKKYKVSQKAVTEVFTASTVWTVPETVDGKFHVTVCGAGGAGGTGEYDTDWYYYANSWGGTGGDAGEMATGTVELEAGTTVDITVGIGGDANRANNAAGKSGGATSFGNLLSASGGAGGAAGGINQNRSGGKGMGGAAGGARGVRGVAGVNTVGMGLYSEGSGEPGAAGTDAGSGYYGGGGGGGGYGGKGKDGGSVSNNGFGWDAYGGGGGGGYGAANYGAGGTAGAGGSNSANPQGEKGSDGICIVTYKKLAVEE